MLNFCGMEGFTIGSGQIFASPKRKEVLASKDYLTLLMLQDFG